MLGILFSKIPLLVLPSRANNDGLGKHELHTLPGPEGYVYMPYQPVMVSEKGNTVHEVWDLSSGEQQGYVVHITRDELNVFRPYLYHAYEQKSPTEALRLAEKSVRSLCLNKIRAESYRVATWSWLRDNQDIVITKRDAQDAGFCLWGVQQFWEEFEIPDEVNGTLLLEYILIYEAPGFWIVAYHMMESS